MGIREDIDILDGKVSRLKIEYEQYFARVLKREPAQLRDEIEKAILFYTNTPITSTSIKFRFASIVARYNSYKQYWVRTLRAIDDGTYVRKAEGAWVKPATPSPQALSQSRAETSPGADKTQGAASPPEFRDVYDKYITAKKGLGESVEGVTYQALAKSIEGQLRQLRDKHNVEDVAIDVVVKDGKAKLTIRPRKG